MMYYCFNYKFESNTAEYEENTEPTVNVKVSSMFEFSYRPQVFYDFYWVERRIHRTLNVDRDVDVLVADLRKQQSRGYMKNNIHEEWN